LIDHALLRYRCDMSRVNRRWPLGAVIAVVGLVILAYLQRSPIAPRSSPERIAPPAISAEGVVERPRPSLPASVPDEEAEEAAAPTNENAAADVPPNEDLDIDGEPMGGTWNNFDMNAVRAALPDNIYWKMSEPTKDEQAIEERERERARWNVEYGKVLSGTGTDEEIRAYYDNKSRISADYIEFSTYLLDHYESELPDRDVALLQLARRLHQARLEEVPRKLEEAFERKRAQDAARAAWLADEKAFNQDAEAAGQ